MGDFPLAIFGLGNPESKYDWTRHNIGFQALDLFKNSNPLDSSWSEKEEHSSLVSKTKVGSKNLFLVKPQTYMNLSGEAVLKFTKFYKIPLSNILVLHDEVDLDFGAMKFQKQRGHGGHNGIRNIHHLLADTNYGRLKLGVKRAEKLENMATDSFVLGKFDQEEKQYIEGAWKDLINKALVSWIQSGLEKTASLHSIKKGVFS